jgi:hypothetical protein
MDVDTIFVTACALIALVIVAVTIRPSAAPAVALVLTVLGQALARLVPWSSRTRASSSRAAGDG